MLLARLLLLFLPLLELPFKLILLGIFFLWRRLRSLSNDWPSKVNQTILEDLILPFAELRLCRHLIIDHYVIIDNNRAFSDISNFDLSLVNSHSICQIIDKHGRSSFPLKLINGGVKLDSTLKHIDILILINRNDGCFLLLWALFLRQVLPYIFEFLDWLLVLMRANRWISGHLWLRPLPSPLLS